MAIWRHDSIELVFEFDLNEKASHTEKLFLCGDFNVEKRFDEVGSNVFPLKNKTLIFYDFPMNLIRLNP